MAHDVFVSYSNKDKPVADAVVAGLESKGIRCWIAPRDVTPGTSWGEAIVDAIEACQIMVIILSRNADQSRQVLREVERAVANEVVIIPFRIENVDPTGAMAYFLSTEHWLDALTPPLERHIEKLSSTVQLFLSNGDASQLERHPAEAVVDKGPLAAIRRWWPMLVAAVLFMVLGMAAIGLVLIPRLAGQAPAVAPPLPTAATPTDTPPSPTLTRSIPTPTPTATPTFSVIGGWPTSREAHSVFVRDDTAYLANGADGLVILDVSDPSRPQEIGTYPLENARNVIVSENVAYVAEQGLVSDMRSLSDRLVLIDVKIPSSPRLLGEYEPEGGHVHRSLNNLAVEDNTVFLTTSNRLILVDVSTRSDPVTIGEFEWRSNVASPGVAVIDGIAYAHANRLHVVDVRNRAEPVEIGGFEPGWGSSIVVVEETAYLAGWDTGLSIIDVTTPSRPVRTGRYFELVGDHELLPPGASSRQTFLRVSVSDTLAYVTYIFGVDHGTWTQTVEGGIIAVDVSDPANPMRTAVHSELDEVSSVFSTGDLVFVTDESQGLLVMTLNANP